MQTLVLHPKNCCRNTRYPRQHPTLYYCFTALFFALLVLGTTSAQVLPSMTLALVPIDNIPDSAIPISMDQLQHLSTSTSEHEESKEDMSPSNNNNNNELDSTETRASAANPLEVEPEIFHTTNDTIVVTGHLHNTNKIHFNSISPALVEFLKTVIVAADRKEAATISNGSTTTADYTTPIADQFVIVSTVFGMSLLVGLISYRKQRKWKLQNKRHNIYSTKKTIPHEQSKPKLFSTAGLNRFKQRLMGKKQQKGGEYYGDPSLVSGSSVYSSSLGDSPAYGYDTFSTVSGGWTSHGGQFAPVFSPRWNNSDLEKFDV